MANFDLKKLFGIPKSKTAEEIAQENAFKGDVKKSVNEINNEIKDIAENLSEAKNITFNNNSTNLSAQNVQNAIEEVKDIATGARLAIVFSTKEDLDNWLLGTFTRPDGLLPADLKIGENIYIVDINVPDYWWDGTQAQMLETKDSAEIINLIKPDGVDTAAFKGVTAKTTSYSGSLGVTLDGITVKVSGGSANSTGTLSYTNNTGGWILAGQMHIYDSGAADPHQYLIANGNTQNDVALVGYTRGMIYRLRIGTYQGNIYEGDVFVASGTTSTGITVCTIRLRRIA